MLVCPTPPPAYESVRSTFDNFHCISLVPSLLSVPWHSLAFINELHRAVQKVQLMHFWALEKLLSRQSFSPSLTRWAYFEA